MALLAAALLAGAATPAAATPAPASAGTRPPEPPNDPGGTMARTPPMGFNNWAGFECDDRMNEKLFTDTADQMVKLGLDKLGYSYVNVDDCWMRKARDANGHLQVNKDRFPHGMKWLGDYVHAKGLKFGIYEDAGYKTCQNAAGSYGHFQTDADDYASWGVDYLKLDYCHQPLDKYPSKTPADVAHIVYHKASQALGNTGRPIVFSESAPAYFCCSGQNFEDVMSWIADEGQLWRFGSDIADTWQSVMTNYHQGNTPGLAEYAGPGHWNDADMLETGNGGMTNTEYRSQFLLWSEMASPLLLSTDLSKLSPEQLDIVRNRDVIAVDQDPLGKQATIVDSGKGYDVLSRPLANGDHAVTLFNYGSAAQDVTTDAHAVGLDGDGPCTMRNLVTKKRNVSHGTISAHVPSHGTVMYRIGGHPGHGHHGLPGHWRHPAIRPQR